jgi:hypothetical protein
MKLFILLNLLSSFGLRWDMVGGQPYYLWSADDVRGPWRSLAIQLQAGTNVLAYPYAYIYDGAWRTNTNNVTFVFVDREPVPGWIAPETGCVVMEWPNTTQGFFKVTTDPGGATTINVNITYYK